MRNNLALALLVMCGFGVPGRAQTLTTIYNFSGTDGSAPYAGLTLGTDGNFYGVTYSGGATGQSGTVFKITPSGLLTTIYNFTGPDGSGPHGGLAWGNDGNLYGTTDSGGASGAGTVFQVTTSGTLTTLHSFSGADGSYPLGALTLGNDGNFYGTTSTGGLYGGGTVFNISPAGVFNSLYNFTGTKGAAPSAALILGGDGNFYGTTENGGVNTYYGTVFKVTPAGVLTTLYSFGFTDGANPYAALTPGGNGNLYGTTSNGGANTQFGTVFSVTPAGVLTTLYNFAGSDGSAPESALILGADGNFYGTSVAGGGQGQFGSIFKITPAGVLTTLYNFSGADASSPTANLTLGTDGNLYGTAGGGGANGYGTVFRLIVCPSCTVVSLTSASNPSVYGSQVSLSASVAAPGSGTPTGSVTFMDSGVAIGSAALSGGSAAFTTAALSPGQHSVTAVYSGDGVYQAGTSAVLQQMVNRNATTTTVSANVNPAVYGSTVTLSATVASGGPTPTGTITFKNGATTIGTATLSAGAAAFSVVGLSAGTDSITAAYSGDGFSAAGSSPVLNLVVNPVTTATRVTSSKSPSNKGQAVTFTADVTSAGPTPAGTVTFTLGATVLGTPTLVNGSASVTVSSMARGADKITATFNPSPDFTGSSGSFKQTVR